MILALWILFVATSIAISCKTGNMRFGKYTGWQNAPIILQYLVFYAFLASSLIWKRTEFDFLGKIGTTVAYAAFVFYVYLLWIFKADYKPGIDVDARSRLFDKGPYRLIRHPIYSAQMAMMLGTSLSLRSAFVLMLLPSFVCFYLTARIEEILMSKHVFGYIPYKQRTKMFLPYLF